MLPVLIVAVQDESVHTKLGSCYIDEVLKLSSDENALQRLKSSRENLLTFLQESQYYQAPVLLSKVHDTELYRECALLYGRVSWWLCQFFALFVCSFRWRNMRKH